MKAISIKQPWAWLIVNGHKDVENRDWKYFPKYTGDILIHASKGGSRREFDEAVEFSLSLNPSISIPGFTEIDKGGIVGVAQVEGFVYDHKSPWFFGPGAFILSNPMTLSFHPCRGQLGIFECPAYNFTR